MTNFKQILEKIKFKTECYGGRSPRWPSTWQLSTTTLMININNHFDQCWPRLQPPLINIASTFDYPFGYQLTSLWPPLTTTLTTFNYHFDHHRSSIHTNFELQYVYHWLLLCLPLRPPPINTPIIPRLPIWPQLQPPQPSPWPQLYPPVINNLTATDYHSNLLYDHHPLPLWLPRIITSTVVCRQPLLSTTFVIITTKINRLYICKILIILQEMIL